ncbi:D-serine ammonia-lyase [Lactiplantibacillus plantarum subsp. plantarum]|uniref:D-serine ammonia-lyase n=1 Tax=Lactiplantibacillus plantarum subsp. plantarum TaxID=337330 RepID=A0A2S3U6Q4_LACPN|nr:D-serine ammonia-lyase [Lactiplantibacillus plantarum subsp. plantarum]
MDTTVMIEEHPQIKELMAKRPIVWQNPDYGKRADLPLTRADIFDAGRTLGTFRTIFGRCFSRNGSYE